MEYTEATLKNLIADVTAEFSTVLAKAEESFKPKDESEKKDEPKEEPKKEAESESKKDEGVKDQHQQDDSKPKGDEPKLESKEERVEGDRQENAKPTDDAHGDAQDHGYDDEDMQHMHSMYSSMSPQELRAHHDCIRKCMDGSMGKSEEEMVKSEKDLVVEVAQIQEVSLLKSELEAVKAESESRKKDLDALAGVLTKFVVEKTAPAGKAITELGIIAKGGDHKEEKVFTKAEIDGQLLAKSKEASLAKSDRDAINSYYFNKNIDTVRHLLSK